MGDRLLINHFYAHNVGHAVEALHYAHGHWRFDPSREVSVLLPARAPTELAALCPWVVEAYGIDHPFLELATSADADALEGTPRAWTWVVDDFRRHQEDQLRTFPGMRAFYEASDAWFQTAAGRTVEGAEDCGYRQAPWRFALEPAARSQPGPQVALLTGGSAAAAGHIALRDWWRVLDALREAFGPGIEVVLLGKRFDGDGRTSTGLDPTPLLDHPAVTVDAVDLPLTDQLARVAAADVFLSPHTGFGLAASGCGTPWLTISGGRWWEYFFNGVPFRSVLPSPEHQDAPYASGRIAADLPRIVAAAQELVARTLSYEDALRDHFAGLVALVGRDALWSIDSVHAAYV